MKRLDRSLNFPISVVRALVGVFGEKLPNRRSLVNGGLNPVFNRLIVLAWDGHGGFRHAYSIGPSLFDYLISFPHLMQSKGEDFTFNHA